MGSAFATSLISRLFIASAEFLVLGFVAWIVLSLFSGISPRWRRRVWLIAICKPVITMTTCFLDGIVPLPASFCESWTGKLMFPGFAEFASAGTAGAAAFVFCVAGNMWLAVTLGFLISVWWRAAANRRFVDESLEKGFCITAKSLRRLERGLILPKGVRVVVTPEDYGPVALGVFEPVIVIPETLLPWLARHRRPTASERARLCQIIRHEFAHIQSGDYLVTVLSHIVLSFFWFHPVAYMACRRLRISSESWCDQRVLLSGVKAKEYAATLMNIVSGKQVSKSLALAFFSDDRPVRVLHDRLDFILADRAADKGVHPAWGYLVLVLMIATLPRFLSFSALPSLELLNQAGQAGRSAGVASASTTFGDGAFTNGMGASAALPVAGQAGAQFADGGTGQPGVPGFDGFGNGEGDSAQPGAADASAEEALAKAGESDELDDESEDSKPKKQKVRRLAPLADPDDDHSWPGTTSQGSRRRSH